MAGINLGPDHALAIRLQWMEDNIKELSNRDDLIHASIGQGGITVNNGGSITIVDGGTLTIEGTGTLSVASGGLDSAGTITAATTISAGTSVSAPAISGTSSVTGADVYTLNGPSYNITGGRVACWLETATGRVGMATSSERFKVILGDGEIDVNAVLSMRIVRYQYKAEVAKRDDPESEDYVGADYQVPIQTGLIAERLDEAGLTEWVFYEADGITPMGIHYSELTVPLLAVAQALARRLDGIEARLARSGL